MTFTIRFQLTLWFTSLRIVFSPYAMAVIWIS